MTEPIQTTDTQPIHEPNFLLSLETRGIVIRGEAFVVEGSLNVAAEWADLSEKLEALGIRVTPQDEPLASFSVSPVADQIDRCNSEDADLPMGGEPDPNR